MYRFREIIVWHHSESWLPENPIGDGMRLEWFSKHPVCKRPFWLLYSYDVSFAVQYITGQYYTQYLGPSIKHGNSCQWEWRPTCITSFVILPYPAFAYICFFAVHQSQWKCPCPEVVLRHEHDISYFVSAMFFWQNKTFKMKEVGAIVLQKQLLFINIYTHNG